MMATRPITLWQPPSTTSGRPSSFVISSLVHVLAVAAVCIISIRHVPTMDVRPRTERYTVRFMDLRAPVFKLQRSAGESIAYPRQLVNKSASTSKGLNSAAAAAKASESPTAAKASAPETPQPLRPALQTLVQPDAPPNAKLPRQIPLPSVVLWSAENSTSRKIIPPPPQEAAAVILSPKIDPPNHALTLAQVRISPTPFLTQTPALPPSTTSPITVRGPGVAKQIPQTTAKLEQPPTPARVLSISELKVMDGTVALPLVNEIAPAAKSQDFPKVGTANPASKQNTAGQNASASSGTSRSTGKQGASSQAGAGPSGANQKRSGPVGAQHAAGKQKGARVRQASGDKKANPESGSTPHAKESGTVSKPGRVVDTPDEAAAGDINLPQDGKFLVTVVGSSLAEQYPETVGILSSRLAYTVYLHVGLSKNWILQYSLPRVPDADGSGKSGHLEAPWPYHMVRPRLELGDLNADALMIHGFVNIAGRFERLAIVFPPDFAQSKFVLATLEKWHFRPATQDGENVLVEVLLIIPEQPE